MSILEIKDENGVWHGVYALKGEKGDRGGSVDEDALDEIKAIQDELIKNGSVVSTDLPIVNEEDNGKVMQVVNGEWSAEYVNGVSSEDELPDVTPEDNGKVLTVVNGEWDKAYAPSGSGGGQAEFATVTDYEGGGKNLTTEGSLGLNANNVVVNGASFSKDGNFTKIAGVSVPEDADQYFAVNKKYVDEAVANAGGGGGGSAPAATPDWDANEGEEGYIKNRTHHKEYTETLSLDNLSVATSGENCYSETFDTSYAEFTEPFDLDQNPLFVVGDTYRVVYDGKAYDDCVAFAAREGVTNKHLAVGWSGYGATTSSGAPAYSGGEERLPFFILNRTGTSVEFCTDTAGEHTFSISHCFDRYVTLDPNYLPDSVRADKLEKRLPNIIDNFVTGLPDVDATYNGKVMKVVDGKWSVEDDAGIPVAGSDGYVLTSVKGEWKAAASKKELPEVGMTYEDMVLMVVNGKWGVADLPQELPTATAQDNGMVLQVVNGKWDKADAPAGGVTPVDYIIEEGAAEARDAQSSAVLCNDLTYRKWNNGLLEITGKIPYTTNVCQEYGGMYFRGQCYLLFRYGANPQPVHSTDVVVCSASGMGVFLNGNAEDYETAYAHVSISYYSLASASSSQTLDTSVYIRGRWK